MKIEMAILDWIQSIRTPTGDILIPLITKLGDAGAIWILMAIVLLLIPKTRKSGAVLAAALCVDIVLCNGILKNLFCRIRPCDVNTSVRLLVERPADFSFPSGHTAASFAAAAALWFVRETPAVKWKLWKPALALALLMAFSRLYLYVHYPTDILGGMITGIAAGYIGKWLIGQLEKRGKNEP